MYVQIVEPLQSLRVRPIHHYLELFVEYPAHRPQLLCSKRFLWLMMLDHLLCVHMYLTSQLKVVNADMLVHSTRNYHNCPLSFWLAILLTELHSKVYFTLKHFWYLKLATHFVCSKNLTNKNKIFFPKNKRI